MHGCYAAWVGVTWEAGVPSRFSSPTGRMLIRGVIGRAKLHRAPPILPPQAGKGQQEVAAAVQREQVEVPLG